MNFNRRISVVGFFLIAICLGMVALARKEKNTHLVEADTPTITTHVLGSRTPEGIPTPDLPAPSRLFPQKQTLGDVTVSLDWLEIDEAALRYRVSITGYEIPDNVSPDNVFLDISLSDDSGLFPSRGHNALTAMSSIDESGKITQEETVYIDIEADDFPALDVDINVQVGGFDALPSHQKRSYGENTELVPLPLVGDFTFNVTVPVHQVSKLDLVVQESQVAGDLAVQLQSLHLGGAHSNGLLCFQLPDQGDWQIDLRNSEILGFDAAGNSETVLPRGWSMANPKNSLSGDYGQRCIFLNFELSRDQLPRRIRVSIPRLIAPFGESPTDDQINRAIQDLAEIGITAVYHPMPHTQPLEIVTFPESMEVTEAYSWLRSALQDTVEGPWEFDVVIPETPSMD